MKTGKVTTSVLVMIVICLGTVMVTGNRTNDVWHYLLHGDDRITFEHRHFVSPTNVPLNSTNLVATGETYFNQQIYVASPSDPKSLPTEVFIKKNGQVIEYSLSGGF